MSEIDRFEIDLHPAMRKTARTPIQQRTPYHGREKKKAFSVAKGRANATIEGCLYDRPSLNGGRWKFAAVRAIRALF